MKMKLVESLSDQNLDLDEFFGPKLSIVELHKENRWDVIDELLDSLEVRQKIHTEHKDAIRTCLRKREISMSTGIGFGVGLPHASTEFVSDLVTVVGRSRNGIEFDSLDGKPVNLVMLFLVPQGQFQKHLNTLASLAKLLQDEDFRAGLERRFE